MDLLQESEFLDCQVSREHEGGKQGVRGTGAVPGQDSVTPVPQDSPKSARLSESTPGLPRPSPPI